MGMGERGNHRGRSETSNRHWHRYPWSTLRYDLAGPGTERRMSRFLRMVMRSRRLDGHRRTASAQQN